MNREHRAIRALISSMSPKRALKYIAAFDLPEDEANSIIECEVRGKSYVQVCEKLGMSRETLKKCRQRAFAKIADAINHNEAPLI